MFKKKEKKRKGPQRHFHERNGAEELNACSNRAKCILQKKWQKCPFSLVPVEKWWKKRCSYYVWLLSTVAGKWNEKSLESGRQREPFPTRAKSPDVTNAVENKGSHAGGVCDGRRSSA